MIILLAQRIVFFILCSFNNLCLIVYYHQKNTPKCVYLSLFIRKFATYRRFYNKLSIKHYAFMH